MQLSSIKNLTSRSKNAFIIHLFAGQRIQDGSGRNTPEHGSSIPAGKFLDFFRCIPITFLCFPARNWSEIFRPESCFYVPMISGVFLQDPAFFPSLSCRFLRDMVTRIFDLGLIKTDCYVFYLISDNAFVDEP